MKWEDEGIVVYKKAVSEKGSLLGVLSHQHGFWKGWIRGSLPQLGEHVHASWSARTEDQLGSWKIEVVGLPSALQAPERLVALSSLCQLCQQLPERHAYPAVFDAIQAFKESENNWRGAYIHFELTLLKEIGFGLSLETCAVTGKEENLAYVSPKTGCAVTQEVGQPYHDQLLPLPLFMTEPVWPVLTPEMYEEALQLTGYFILKNIGQGRLPHMREMLAA